MPNPTISSLTLPVKNPTTGEVTNVTYDLPSGGSSGGGHTIENSAGTDLTQRDTLKFGAGLSATDDSTNEKTVINPDTMTSSDMDDVITPIPGPMPTREGIKYSTTEQMVGEWIDGKTLYEKTIIYSISGVGWNSLQHNISNIDSICPYAIFLRNAGGTLLSMGYLSETKYAIATVNQENISVNIGSDFVSAWVDIVATIRYTKTTD